MAASYSSSIDSTMITNDKTVHVSTHTEKSSNDNKPDPVTLTNAKRNKRKLSSEEYRQLSDKLLEIEQIKYEEYLVNEQINRINIEKQYLQNLLNKLHDIDSNDRINTHSQNRPRRLQKFSSDLN